VTLPPSCLSRRDLCSESCHEHGWTVKSKGSGDISLESRTDGEWASVDKPEDVCGWTKSRDFWVKDSSHMKIAGPREDARDESCRCAASQRVASAKDFGGTTTSAGGGTGASSALNSTGADGPALKAAWHVKSAEAQRRQASVHAQEAKDDKADNVKAVSASEGPAASAESEREADSKVGDKDCDHLASKQQHPPRRETGARGETGDAYLSPPPRTASPGAKRGPLHRCGPNGRAGLCLPKRQAGAGGLLPAGTTGSRRRQNAHCSRRRRGAASIEDNRRASCASAPMSLPHCQAKNAESQADGQRERSAQDHAAAEPSQPSEQRCGPSC